MESFHCNFIDIIKVYIFGNVTKIEVDIILYDVTL